jgi:signal transduction histidine kinase/HPt (histidine-containing phosphotransfer) domain-containing protein
MTPDDQTKLRGMSSEAFEEQSRLFAFFSIGVLCVLVNVLLSVFAALYYTDGLFVLFYLVVACIGSGLLFVVYKTRTIMTIAKKAGLFVLLALAVPVYYTGGPTAGNCMNMLVLPVIAILFLGRLALPWMGASLFVLLGMVVMKFGGFEFPHVINPSVREIDSIAKVVGSFIFVCGVMLYSEISRRLNSVRIQAARDRANNADQAKLDFLANISHEIRTPLNGVIGITEMALRESHGEPVIENLELIRKSANSLLTLVDDILDFSKVEAGKIDLRAMDFNLRATMSELFDIVRIQADQKKLALRYQIAEDVPDHLLGDPQRFGQVIMNLLNNAIKFTQQGEVMLQVESGTRTSEELQLLLKVSDTGIGIPLHRQEAIFNAFTQVDGSTTRRFGGSGLGLAIAAKLVALMGGKIRVESRPEQGTTFLFDVWFGWSESRSEESRLSPSIDLAVQATSPAGSVRGLRVLLAEDNEINQRVTVSMLASHGHVVDVVNNGVEALDALRKNKYNAILMDVQMPEMDGLEATRMIRELEENTGKHIRVIAMTAHAMPGDRERCLASGMDGYLAKPVRPDDLLAMLVGAAPLKQQVSIAEGMQPCDPDVLNTEELLARTRGDKKLISELVGIFLESTPKLVDSICESTSANDAEGVYRAAHSLKGAAAMMGASQVQAAAYSIEMKGRQQQLDDAKKDIDELERAIKILKPALVSLLGAKQRNSA